MSENNGLEGPQGKASPAAEAILDAHSVRDVFISYASQDSELANSVVQALERSGLTCWIAPRDVVPGDLYADGIVRAITGSKVFVLVLSRNAIASNHVGKEVERASSKRRPIVAIRTDTTPLTPSLEYFLSESQWIDLHAGQTDAALNKVVDAVRRQRGVEPVKSTTYVAPKSSRTPKRLWMGGLALVGLLVAVAAYFIVNRFREAGHGAQSLSVTTPLPADHMPGLSAPVISEKSVAVLPFVDMSEKKDQEYFSDGLSEELIDMLTKVAELRVPARTSSFYFKGKSEDIPTIAKRLLVAHVLEGSVRKSGTHMRITVQLVRADNGYHVWSRTYDRQVDDIFKVQDEIAGAVVKALKISLLESGVPSALPTSTTDAYLLYMKGIALFRRATLENTLASIATLQESLKLDPDYAPAWVMLARALRTEYLSGHGTYAEVSPRVLAAAERAIKLDPKLPDGYVALAGSYLLDWQWNAADDAIKKALALEPNSPLALKFASFLASHRGQSDLALRYAEAALVRDPLDFMVNDTVFSANLVLERYATAEAVLRRNLELNPQQSEEGFHSGLAFVKFKEGDPAAALAEIEQEPQDQARLYGRVIYLTALGRGSEADADFAVYLKKYAVNSPYLTASLYARRGDTDRAFEWLDRAYQQHDGSLSDLNDSFGFKGLHSDPRYKAMLRKMNLPE